jgi:hypothetical protein
MFVNFRRETVQFRMEIKSHPHISSPSKNWVQSLDCSDPAIVTRPENRSSEAATLPSLCAKRLRLLRLQICFVSQFPMFQISSVVTTPYLTDLTGSPSIHFTLSFLGLFANKNRESFTLARKESAKKLRIWNSVECSKSIAS